MMGRKRKLPAFLINTNMSLHKIRRKIAPITVAVTPDDVRRWSLIDGDDDFLETLINAAVAMIDGPDGIGISLLPSTWSMDVDDACSPITVKLAPVTSAVSLEWIDRNGEPQASIDLRVTANSSPAKVYHKLNINAEPGSVVLTFKAGYEEVPADLKKAILSLVSHLYENREATNEVKLEEVPFGVRSVLDRYNIG